MWALPHLGVRHVGRPLDPGMDLETDASAVVAWLRDTKFLLCLCVRGSQTERGAWPGCEIGEHRLAFWASLPVIFCASSTHECAQDVKGSSGPIRTIPPPPERCPFSELLSGLLSRRKFRNGLQSQAQWREVQLGRMGEVPSGLYAASCTWGLGRVHRELGTCVSEVPGLGAQRSFLILGEEL